MFIELCSYVPDSKNAVLLLKINKLCKMKSERFNRKSERFNRKSERFNRKSEKLNYPKKLSTG